MDKKLDKKAHARAIQLHEQRLKDDPEYRRAWENLVAELFTGLADTKMPNDALSSRLREAMNDAG